MKSHKTNISFSLLSLSIFLLITFTFSSHAFCVHATSSITSGNNSLHQHSKISSDKNDLNTANFLGEVEEEVEENESENHLLDLHLPALFTAHTYHIHSQVNNLSSLSYSTVKTALSSAPVFIKNCTLLI